MEAPLVSRAALACSLAGLALLFLVSAGTVLPEPIGSMSIEMAGRAAGACGLVTSAESRNNHLFIDMEDETGSIRFVIFNSSAPGMNGSGFSPYDIRQGMRICVQGIIDEYPKGSGRVELVYRRGDILVYG